jgi:hypothetical protein
LVTVTVKADLPQLASLWSELRVKSWAPAATERDSRFVTPDVRTGLIVSRDFQEYIPAIRVRGARRNFSDCFRLKSSLIMELRFTSLRLAANDL